MQGPGKSVNLPDRQLLSCGFLDRRPVFLAIETTTVVRIEALRFQFEVGVIQNIKNRFRVFFVIGDFRLRTRFQIAFQRGLAARNQRRLVCTACSNRRILCGIRSFAKSIKNAFHHRVSSTAGRTISRSLTRIFT